MNCSQARDRLVGGTPTESLERHLGTCPSCRAFAERAEIALAKLREREAEVVPEAGFAARVTAALPGDPEVLAWAALRLLPATVALALVLTGWCLTGVPGPSELVEESPADAPLAWLLETNEVKGSP